MCNHVLNKSQKFGVLKLNQKLDKRSFRNDFNPLSPAESQN